MTTSGIVKDEETQDPFVGYGFEISNDELGVVCFGSPFEVIEEVELRGLRFGDFAKHKATRIGARRVYKREPELAFSGGPNAEAVLELLAALDAHDIAGLGAVIARHPALRDTRDPAGAVPLLSAIATGDVAGVRVLAENHVGLDLSSHFAMTPLHWAAALGEPGIAAVLLDAGAECSRYSWFLVQPGELAVLNKHEGIGLMISAAGGAAGAVDARETLNRMCVPSKRPHGLSGPRS